MDVNIMIGLGDKVRDKITGFEGLALEKSEYLNGCVQFEVQPKIDKEGKIPDSCHIDEQQLEVIEETNPSKVFDPRESNPPITLGEEVRDTLLGFEGVAISKSTSITGYVQIDVQPKRDKEEKLPDSEYVSAMHLEVINKIEPEEEPEKTGGGVRNHPPKRL